MAIEIHMLGKGFSGRAVRYRTLSPDERDQVSKNAARAIEPGATNVDYRITELREGVKAFLVAVTKLPMTKEQLPLATESEWEPLDKAKLGLDGPLNYSRLFKNPKEDDLLCRAYKREHEASAEEIEDILGKAHEVSTA